MTTRWLKFAPAGLVLLLAALLRIADPGVIADLRLAVFDTFLRAAPRTPNPQYPVRIVTIDEASLKAFGQWPWPRTVLADIIDKLNDAGAKTISLDIILPEADRLSPKALAQRVPKTSDFENLRAAITKLPNSDEVLASSLKKSTAVVGFSGDPTSTGVLADAKAGIASAGDDPEPFLPRFPAAISSLSIFNEVATGLGAVNWLPQRDQLVRRVPMLVSIGGKIYPTLSAEAFRVHKGDSTVFVKSSGSSGATAFGQKTGIEQLRIGDTVLPVNREGELWLYLTKPDPKRYISAQHVLSDSFDASTVEGRDIFIGASAAGLLDLRATPLSTSVPGVEIHAQALEQMRAGTHLVRPAYATGYELLFLLAVGAAIAAMIVYVGPTLAAIAGLAMIFAVCFASWSAFQNAGLLFDPVYPSLALVALYIAGSLGRYIVSERERAYVRSAFQSYVSPTLVEQLAQNHEKLALGGETRNVTLMFADIRGFSGISEGLAPDDLIQVINDLFDPLSDVIFDHGGTIDKYMGDAMMAFWNAPLDDPDHARNACIAALEMQARLHALNQTWAQKAVNENKQFKDIQVGIGVNTGACCVGNMGSTKRFDYSVIGDVVNVAARLESETKSYKVPIIVGLETAKAVQDFALLPLDEIVPRGKTIPQKVYALIGDPTYASSAEFKTLLTNYQAYFLNSTNRHESGLKRIANVDLATNPIINIEAHLAARIAKGK